MKHLIHTPTAKLTEAEWQSLRLSFVRKGMIGGSDAGTLLGLNQYKSPINMFYQSVGISNPPNIMNSAMLHGKQMEDYVAKCWQYYDGTDEGWVENTLANNRIKRYKKLRSIITNPKYPVLFANVDGIITKHPVHGKKQGILEIKTISGYSADSYEAGIPPSYLIQVQHYMLVTELKYAEICYLKDGRQLGVVTFNADDELQERILTAAYEFQNRVSQAQELIQNTIDMDEKLGIAAQYEPDADDSDAFNQFLSEKHKALQTEIIMQGGEDMLELAKQYKRYGDFLKSVEKQKQFYQNKIKQVMERNEASIMMLPEGKVTWRKQFNVQL
jgi:putative phage-type endonuclease